MSDAITTWRKGAASVRAESKGLFKEESALKLPRGEPWAQEAVLAGGLKPNCALRSRKEPVGLQPGDQVRWERQGWKSPGRPQK